MGVQHSKATPSNDDRSTSSTVLSSVLGKRRASLFSLLLRQEWDSAIQRIKRHPREARRSLKTIYPIHVACVCPEVPLDLLQALVEADPRGPMRYSQVCCSDVVLLDDNMTATSNDSNSTSSVVEEEKYGWLPLHIAVYYGVSLDVLQFLLDTYPASVTCKNGRGLLPLHLAIERPNEHTVDVVSLLIKAFGESIYIPSSQGKMPLEMVEEAEDLSPEIRGALLEMLQPGAESVSSGGCTQRVVQSLYVRYSRFRKKTSPFKANKLVVAIASRNWDEATRILARKPNQAQVWTLSDSSIDPPCHVLALNMALRRKAPYSFIAACLEAYPDAVHAREYYGMLPLHVASQAGASLDITREIYKANHKAACIADMSGLLPLHLACLSDACRRDVILFLLQAYPEGLAHKDNRGFLARDYVTSGGHPHQSLLLSDFGCGQDYWAASTDKTLLEQCILKGNWQDATVVLADHPEQAAVWHLEGKQRRLPLHDACTYKAPAILVKALVEAYPQACRTVLPEEYNLLPLHLACQHGSSVDVVKLLLTVYKEAASIADSHGLLALHLAITEGASVDVVEALVEANPQAVLQKDGKGRTPMFYVESSHHPNARQVKQVLKSATSSMKQPVRGEDCLDRPQAKRQKSDRSLTAASA